MSTRFFLVDAFASRAFSGNPAAVCLLSGPADETWMRQVARETNLSETAFLYPEASGYSLRWFTPVREVDLCGHATLASAHILWETGLLAHKQPAQFMTRSGLLSAQQGGDLIWLDFPRLKLEPGVLSAEMQTALGVTPRQVYQCGEKLLIEVASEQEILDLRPDFAAMLELPGRGIAVTSVSSSSEDDFVSRYFAPWVGVNEDPVTGSIHCGLGPYWAGRLGKNCLQARQASARGGRLSIQLQAERILLGGQAVTTLQGSLLV